jgi:dTDP-4-dehydrorhamnose 3,5-epimerase
MKKDKQTVTPDGEETAKLIHGVSFKEVPTHVDDRGFVVEMYDSRWTWHDSPLVFSYTYSIRPGIIKGWGMHKKHEDRYFILFGEMELVMYDARKKSPTKGLVSKIYMSEFNRRLVNIPAGVWHANRAIGLKDTVVVNFPTICYDHKDPDKYRLPVNTKKIPYRFDNPKGW